MSKNDKQLKDAVDRIHVQVSIAAALAEAIKEIGSIPSGHLYAMVMDKIDINTYQSSIAALKQAGLVSESFNLLTWISPKIEEKQNNG